MAILAMPLHGQDARGWPLAINWTKPLVKFSLAEKTLL
jgi:hypothetical protein